MRVANGARARDACEGGAVADNASERDTVVNASVCANERGTSAGDVYTGGRDVLINNVEEHTARAGECRVRKRWCRGREYRAWLQAQARYV